MTHSIDQPEANPSADVILRPVSSDCRQFLLRVYACSREIELRMVPWNDDMKRAFVEHQFDAQTVYYVSQFPAARHDLITLSETGESVGRLYVDRSDEMISILDITVLPEYRCRGIGSDVIGRLIDEARESGRNLQVHVETFNPSQSFFKARGFDTKGDDGLNLRLVWSPHQN